MSDYLKGLCGSLALIAILMSATPAQALPSISVQGFALWSPNYCAVGGGSWTLLTDTTGGSHVSLSVGTYSNTGSGGTCATPSTAGANIFAAWAKVEREWPYLSGTWTVCKSASWAGNASGDSSVYSWDSDLVLGCGEGRYRLRSENRITYGGTNQYSPPFVGSPSTFGTP